MAAAQAPVKPTTQSAHKPAAAPVQKELSKMDNYQFIEDHLNTPGTLRMKVDYSLANGTHAGETIDYGIDSAGVSGCVMQYVTQSNVMQADDVPNSESLAIENADEFKAYSAAMALTDSDEKIRALRSFLQKYPKSVGTKNILDELMRAYFANNDRSAIGVATQLLQMNSLNTAALYITDHTPTCAAEDSGYLVHLINCVTRFQMSNVQGTTVLPFGEYIKQRHAALGITTVTATMAQPEPQALIVELKDGQKAVIPITDAALAEKMLHAMTRAVDVCVKLKK
jgi:hypothetical protein